MEEFKVAIESFVQSYGYIALFLIAFTESIFQPIPPDPFIVGASALGLDPFLSALVSTLGSILGGVVAHTGGWLLGENFVKKLIGEESFKKGEAFISRFGPWAVVVGGLTPVPYKVVCWVS